MPEASTIEPQGTLFIVATPIGNLSDITQRAIDTLATVDKVCAEDTRNTRKLLSHLGLKKNLVAFHDHNERQKISTVIEWLDKGEQIALVSDAGTPLISDPGFHLVKTLREQGYKVVPIPGVSALITALSAAGLPTSTFSFEGFLPAKASARQQALSLNSESHYTQVYYESSHRIVASVATMIEVFGEHKQVVLARELTKLYEQYFHGTLAALHHWLLADRLHQKGEFVLILAGHEKKNSETDSFEVSTEQLLSVLVAELPLKQAAKIAAKLTGKSKNRLYKQGMALQNQGNII